MSFHDFPEPPPQFYIVALKSGGFGSFDVYDEVYVDLDSYVNGVNNPQIVYNITWDNNTLVLDRDASPGVLDSFENSDFRMECIKTDQNVNFLYFKAKTINFTQVVNVEVDGYHNSVNDDLTFNVLSFVVSDVVTLDGSVVSGAVVRLFNQVTNEYVGSTTTDANGVYSFELDNSDFHHVLVEYEDGNGLFNSLSYPYVVPEEF